MRRVEVVEDSSDWGLDHGTWSVFKHVYPNADIPIVQLSIDALKPLAFHYELARRLAPLRDEGVLLTGSGNVVHNLRLASWQGISSPYEWAARFNADVRKYIVAGDHKSLVDMAALGDDGATSIPTPEHYIPLLYVIALQRPDDPIVFLTDGIALRSISMMSVAVG